jgi:LuxR family transcriptional regulator of csgAB operon
VGVYDAFYTQQFRIFQYFWCSRFARGQLSGALKKWGFIMFNEVHSIHGHTLLLITKPSLQATALLQHLKHSLVLTTKLHNIQRSLDDITANSIILFDMMEADKKIIHYWQENLSRKNNNIRMLLLNTPDEYPFRDIENWPHINGVFYVSEDESRLIEGLQGVLRGECYFSQKLASYLITHSGNYRYNGTDTTLLTHREKEILNKLRIGASNNEIARSLFISENTVKTHLYNLFKKISVKNRTQAVSWANDNLRR